MSPERICAAADARINSNGAASTSATKKEQNGSPAVGSIRVTSPPVEPRFQGAVGRESPVVAQVALDPAATPLVDLNAATFEGADPNRIRLADLIMNDGELQQAACLLVPKLSPQI